MRPPTQVTRNEEKSEEGKEKIERREVVKYLHRLTCRVSSFSSFDEWRSCLGQSIPGTTVDAAAFLPAPFRSTFAAPPELGYATTETSEQ